MREGQISRYAYYFDPIAVKVPNIRSGVTKLYCKRHILNYIKNGFCCLFFVSYSHFRKNGEFSKYI